MAEVKWIKIVTDIFDDEKIQLIEGIPECDSIIVVWFKLLCMAGKQNNGGVFMMNEKVTYTDEMLAIIFRRPLNTIRLAIKTFEEFGMIEIINSAITIPKWEKHQSLDKLEIEKAKNRKRVAQYRKKQKAIAECNANGNVTVTECNTDRKEKDEELDKDIKIKKNGKVKRKYGEYKNVLISDEELCKLKDEFCDWDARIERLSEYIASTGKVYKSHIATIRSWARKDCKSDKDVDKDTSYDLNRICAKLNKFD